MYKSRMPAMQINTAVAKHASGLRQVTAHVLAGAGDRYMRTLERASEQALPGMYQPTPQRK